MRRNPWPSAGTITGWNSRRTSRALVWSIIGHLFATLLAWVRIGRLSESEKDLELLVLRQQVVMLEHPPGQADPSLTDREIDASGRGRQAQDAHELLDLRTLAGASPISAGNGAEVVPGVGVPEVGVSGDQGGWSPRTRAEIETLVVRLACENADWGYGKIVGELGKLGYEVSEPTIANILERHGIPPAPQRQDSVNWRHLRAHYKD